MPTSPIAMLALNDLDAFEAQQDNLIAQRLQAVTWELLKFWEAFPEVDTIVLASVYAARNEPGHELAQQPLDLEWSMSARDGRDRLEEYVIRREVGASRWDQGHAQTGAASPYGAWATNRLRRWGFDEHRSVRDLLNDVWALPDGLHRDNPIAPLVQLLEQHLPGSQQVRNETAAAWGQEAQAWCVRQEQRALHQTLDQDAPTLLSAETARPRGRL